MELRLAPCRAQRAEGAAPGGSSSAGEPCHGAARPGQTDEPVGDAGGSLRQVLRCGPGPQGAAHIPGPVAAGGGGLPTSCSGGRRGLPTSGPGHAGRSCVLVVGGRGLLVTEESGHRGDGARGGAGLKCPPWPFSPPRGPQAPSLLRRLHREVTLPCVPETSVPDLPTSGVVPPAWQQTPRNSPRCWVWSSCWGCRGGPALGGLGAGRRAVRGGPEAASEMGGRGHRRGSDSCGPRPHPSCPWPSLSRRCEPRRHVTCLMLTLSNQIQNHDRT